MPFGFGKGKKRGSLEAEYAEYARFVEDDKAVSSRLALRQKESAYASPYVDMFSASHTLPSSTSVWTDSLVTDAISSADLKQTTSYAVAASSPHSGLVSSEPLSHDRWVTTKHLTKTGGFARPAISGGGDSNSAGFSPNSGVDSGANFQREYVRPPAYQSTLSVQYKGLSWSQKFSLLDEAGHLHDPRWRPPERRNLNAGVECQDSVQSLPLWYIRDAEVHPIDHPDYLCATCRHINLSYLFYRSEGKCTARPEDYICLGSYPEMVSQTTCGLCRIVTATIRIRFETTTKQITANLSDGGYDRMLDWDWYLSPFLYSHEQYGPGFQLFLRPDVFRNVQGRDATHEIPSHPFVLRLVTDEARGGRRIPTDHLDFSWIRSTVALCELSTDMPPREFGYAVRAIDTLDMCIVDLDYDDTYVALSYPWGKVNQLKLLQQNEAFLRKPRALSKLFSQLSRTIQDAIILVKKVGQRHLWVDSVCIIQDHAEDKGQQIAQMGEIYYHSFFTIFAISGDDANYGLPGVRQKSRKLKQVLEEVSGLTIANSLPWMEQEDLLRSGAWGSRAWTFQERFRCQRGLFIGEHGMIINCMHVYSPEDEHCWHTLRRNESMLAAGQMEFFTGQDKRCEPYIMEHTNFDSFALYVYGYSRRKLTFESDVLLAFFGILSHLQNARQHGFANGIPEDEFDAGLLWSCLGPSVRRVDPKNQKPLFPSWSWLGWIGTVAYPWTHERDTFMSIENSPLRWLNAKTAMQNQHDIAQQYLNRDTGEIRHFQSCARRLKQNQDTNAAWFTSDDLRLPDSSERTDLLRIWMSRTADHLGASSVCRLARKKPEWTSSQKFKVKWAPDEEPEWRYILHDDIGVKSPRNPILLDSLHEPPKVSHRLTFKTLKARFYIVSGQPIQRKKLYDMQDPIWRVPVCDEAGHSVGYVEVSDPDNYPHSNFSSGEFAVLSRSTIDGKFTPAPDLLDYRRRAPMAPPLEPHLGYGEASPYQISDLAKTKWQAENINEVGLFDRTVYDEKRPWCMFNVLLIETSFDDGGSFWRTERVGIGRIHVDAFLAHQAKMEVVDLD